MTTKESVAPNHGPILEDGRWVWHGGPRAGCTHCKPFPSAPAAPVDLDELERKARGARPGGLGALLDWRDSLEPEAVIALVERIRALEHAQKMLMGCWPAVALSSMDAAHEYVAGAFAEAAKETKE